ncbi:efflux RND transporter periplasmic adaptor subunit [Rhizobium daejeonense]
MNQHARANDPSTEPLLPAETRPLQPGAPRPAPPVGARPPSAPRRANRTLLAAFIIAVALGGALLGIRYFVPRTVDLVTLAPGFFQPELSGPGVLDATSLANVGASIQGAITRLSVERNDIVAKGDLVAEISALDLKAALDATLASSKAARKAVEAAKSDVVRVEAAVENARTNLARQSDLIRSGVTSRSTLESAETTARQAEADLAKARSAFLQAEAQAAAAEANVAASRAQIDKSVITAPIDGVIVARNLNLGDIASPTNAIVEIADPASIVLSARFDESVISSMAPGQTATIRFSGHDEARYAGKIIRISREVDQETREFTVDIAPARLPPNWALGQRGTAIVDLAASEGVIAVPVKSIARRAGNAGVWLVRDGRASWQPVDLGRIGGTRVEILRGLAPGDRLVTRPASVYSWMPVAGAAS